jgi:hypothetical protein
MGRETNLVRPIYIMTTDDLHHLGGYTEYMLQIDPAIMTGYPRLHLSSSRSLRRGLPLRKAARATRVVPSGTGSIGVGLRDMAGLRGGPGIDPREIGRPIGLARFRQQYPVVFD